MGFRTVVIKSRVKLELRLNMMVIRGDVEKKIFINEINTLIIQSTAVAVTAALLNELVKNNIKVVFCDEKFNPSSELLPYYGAHNTSKRYKQQIKWYAPIKNSVWRIIVRQKILGQADVYQSLFDRLSVPLTYEEPEPSDLIKIGNIKLSEDSNGLLEKTVDFINAVVALKNKSAFVFVHLKKYMSDNKIAELYKHCELEKVGLLLIEGRSQYSKLKTENSVTITEDLCELIDIE